MASYGFYKTYNPVLDFNNVSLYFIAPGLYFLTFLFVDTDKERSFGYIFAAPILAVGHVLYCIIFASVGNPALIQDYYGIFDVRQFLPDRWYLILIIFVVLMDRKGGKAY